MPLQAADCRPPICPTTLHLKSNPRKTGCRAEDRSTILRRGERSHGRDRACPDHHHSGAIVGENAYILAAVVLALSLAANGALADTLLDQPYLTGDWGGLRTWLADRGIAPFASYSTGVWANVHG